MSGKTTLRSFADILGTAKLPEKTVPVCLRGDLAADFEELERQLEEAQDVAEKVDSLAGSDLAAELAEKMEALRIEMREDTYTFRLRALSRRGYRALVAEHPPRRSGEETNEADSGFGFNIDTFFEALLRVAIVDPELTDAAWEQLLDRLTDRQFEELSGAAWLLNRQEVDIPFSRAASRTSRSSEPE